MTRRWTPGFVLVAVVAMMGLVGWSSLGLRWANEWVFSVTRGSWSDDIQSVSPHDVAIVPGVMFRNGRPNSYQLERLELALELYRAGKVPAILVSGDEERAGREASGMRQWLIDRGVPPHVVTADPLGTRTLVTMNRAVQLFGVRSAIICTQGIYAPRTAFLARAAGMDAVILVPKAPPRRVHSVNSETFKIALAFIERYVLGRTGAVGASVSTTVAASTSS